MAINKLQSGIRKLKNPLTVVFTADRMSVPSHYFENTERNRRNTEKEPQTHRK